MSAYAEPMPDASPSTDEQPNEVQVDLLQLQQVHAETVGNLELQVARWRTVAAQLSDELQATNRKLLEALAQLNADESPDPGGDTQYAGAGRGADSNGER